ncbi:hypothetical protein PSN13_01343 [Micromonospora saelicesensis]|uniref:Uncharacterized protein n=1 Tax=Micromonospora saelicesensis TaxID=285676 RepID=A0A328NY61_9ACTN|nr:hypothetical protein PSN13_01343 [Micromonospora saelicesensis]
MSGSGPAPPICQPTSKASEPISFNPYPRWAPAYSLRTPASLSMVKTSSDPLTSLSRLPRSGANPHEAPTLRRGCAMIKRHAASSSGPSRTAARQHASTPGQSASITRRSIIRWCSWRRCSAGRSGQESSCAAQAGAPSRSPRAARMLTLSCNALGCHRCARPDRRRQRPRRNGPRRAAPPKGSSALAGDGRAGPASTGSQTRAQANRHSPGSPRSSFVLAAGPQAHAATRPDTG